VLARLLYPLYALCFKPNFPSGALIEWTKKRKAAKHHYVRQPRNRATLPLDGTLS